MKQYFTNRKARTELIDLFNEASAELAIDYSFLEQGDFYTAFKLRNKYIGFIMVKMEPFCDAEILFSFVTRNARRKGHYTEMLKRTRERIVKKLDGEPHGIVISDPKIPYLHEARGAIKDPVNGKMWYDLPEIQKSEKRLIDSRPAIQQANRDSSTYKGVKADAWSVLSNAPWSGGGWGYNPHQYTVKRNWEEKDKFHEMVEFLQNYGERVRYGREMYDVVFFDTHRVWNCSLIEHPFEVSIINRKPITAR